MSEPTLADVLAAIGSLSEKVDANQLATAARFDLVDSRLAEHGQALEAVAGLVHEQQHALARSEARLTSRISDVQQVVHNIKADLAAHTSDPHGHAD
jgi:uncharacterized coiled-coil protein SlyX